MNFRKIDEPLIKILGTRYFKFIWWRHYMFKTRYTKTISPISVSDRKYDDFLIVSTVNFINELKGKINTPSYFNGCNYNGSDQEIYHFLLMKLKPTQIIEIGSGGSTQFAHLICGNSTTITAIDPEPRNTIPENNYVSCRREICQNVPLELFGSLNKNDILFIDSSHEKEEALYHCEHILPVLKKGVYVHHHDIYYPYDINHQWGEQNVVLDYYFNNPDKYRIIFPSAFAYFYNNWFFRTEMKLGAKLPTTSVPCSFWVEKL